MESRYGRWESLRIMRERSGIASGNLARAVGISKQYMSNLEGGARWPSPVLTRAIACALNVPVVMIERRIEDAPGGEEAVS